MGQQSMVRKPLAERQPYTSIKQLPSEAWQIDSFMSNGTQTGTTFTYTKKGAIRVSNKMIKRMKRIEELERDGRLIVTENDIRVDDKVVFAPEVPPKPPVGPSGVSPRPRRRD